MQPIIYKSTDAGAPQLSLTAGVINAVLKGCLVTGYGAKAAAGWEVVHENVATRKLAIRSMSPKSIKSVLLLDDTGTRKADVTAFREWNSSTNVGIGSFGTGAFFKAWYLDYSAKWMVIATNSFFYLFVTYRGDGDTLSCAAAFGDVMSYKADMDFSILMSASRSASWDAEGTGHYSVASSSGLTNFPVSVFPAATAYWGDTSPTNVSYKSNIAMFSSCPMYVDISGIKTNAFALPGLLMPFNEINVNTFNGMAYSLANQYPYVNPVIGVAQPYHGKFWLHTDNWG